MNKLILFLMTSCVAQAAIGQIANQNNTAYGYQAGQSLSNGSSVQNTFVGVRAGAQNNGGNANTFIGFETGLNTNAAANTFIGYHAGLSTTSGSDNVFIGVNAGLGNTTGLANFFLGNNVGGSNSSGNYNTYVGTNSGANNSSGWNNTGIGLGAGAGVSTGSQNTFIGWNASTNNSNIQYATAIGAGAIVSADNAIVLGNNNAKVGIHTSNPQFELSVNGTVGAREVRVTQIGWSDFVFDRYYKLASLQQVDTYIQAHKHLPNIPSAKEVETNGISLGSMDAQLLRKIEELTLYAIQQQKEINRLNRRVNQLSRFRSNK